MTKSHRPNAVRRGLAVAAAAVVLTALAALPAAAERSRATSSRSGSVSRSNVATRTSSGSSTSSSRGGASSTRSGGNTSGGTAHRNPSRPPRPHYPGDYYYGGYGSYWGAYFGFYPWGYSNYYNCWGYWGCPYYPISPYLYYGPQPGGYRDYRLGALDLNVKPKKTEVWVDGQLVGPAGKFDGFPGYLWLPRGRHQVIFYKPGFVTDVREVRVLESTVVKVNLRLVEGESVPPEKLARKDIGVRPRPQPRRQAPEPAPLDEQVVDRIEPGRLVLSIEPGDASVYLDSRFLGTAAELSRLHSGLLVNAGKHTLEVLRPGFRSERQDVVVEPDTEIAVSVVLEGE